jgi:hypothetical protein
MSKHMCATMGEHQLKLEMLPQGGCREGGG